MASEPAGDTGNFEDQILKIIDEQKKQNEKKLNCASVTSSIFYLSVFVLIGLPVWYRTTTPERWPLPDVSSLMVRSQTLAHYYKVSIVAFEEPPFETTQLHSILKSYYPRRISFDNSLSFVHDWTVRKAFEKELNALKNCNNQNNPSNQELVECLDRTFALSQFQAVNSIVFYILPKQFKANQLIVAGKHRAFFVDLNHFQQSDDLNLELAEKFNQQLETVENIVERFYSHEAGDHEQNMMLLMARDFDFVFDIIYEDDESSQVITNMDRQQYLTERKLRHRKFLDKIEKLIAQFYTNQFGFSKYFRINFITQVLHYVFPGENFIKTRLSSTEASSGRVLPVAAAQDILNQVEAKRVEHDSEKSYHLVLYVTSSNLGSLRFESKTPENKSVTSNLVMTPFRGSILIVNNDEDLFAGFRQLIRSFFRLSGSLDEDFFTQNEIESVIHALVQKHIQQTLKSLESIEKLLKKVNNMVIEEKIAIRMQQSVDDSMTAANLLLTTSDIGSVYEHSWSAYQLSEKAFYDPSLLSLLYFPDDQKYAIYLPLFLPICVPVLTNLIFYLKLLLGKNKKEKTD